MVLQFSVIRLWKDERRRWRGLTAVRKGVGDEAFEDGDVFEEPLAADVGQFSPAFAGGCCESLHAHGGCSCTD